MTPETYNTVVLPIRSKARKAYAQALESGIVPKDVLRDLAEAKRMTEQWAERVNPYRDDAETEPTPEPEPVKAKPPTKRLSAAESAKRDEILREIAALKRQNASLKAEQTSLERVAPAVTVVEARS